MYPTIKIIVKGGVVCDVDNLPDGFQYEVIDKDCPKCSSKLYNEIVKEIDYPYVCLNCDENFYNFEITKSEE